MSQAKGNLPKFRARFGRTPGFGALDQRDGKSQTPGKGSGSVLKFNPATFKTQHKG